MKKLISMALAAGMAVSLAACGGAASSAPAADSAASGAASTTEAAADSDLAYIQGKGKMTIGYTVYEPMNYTDADGNFTGFDTELATAVCESWAWSRTLSRSTGIPRSSSWTPRALTASGTA